jgi:hypothetical protein
MPPRLYEALYIGNPNLSIFTSRTKKATNILSNMMAANTQEQNPCESDLSKAE